MNRLNLVIRISAIITTVVLAACSSQHDENESASASEQYETLRRDMASMLGQEPDSTFAVLDSLEAAGSYPLCVINLIRGNMYGQMMSLRFAEFYLRKAIGEELHAEWPRGYYLGIYNLGLSLQERSNLDEALKVSQAGYEEVEQETDPSLKLWETSLQYVIGGCQLNLKQLDEGDKTMQRCYDQLMARAATDTTHATIEQIGTMCTNIALDYYNHYPDATMPWIERAEKALDMLAEHNKTSQQPSNEPIMRVKLQMIKAITYATNGQTEEAKETYDAVMASPYADHPILISDRMVYLEKTGQWDAAADLMPALADFNKEMDLEDYTMENLSGLAESYRIYEKAGRKAEATKMAQQMALIVDSVRLYQDKSDAAELAVIYDTQGKERQIAEQQMRLSRARVMSLVAFVIFLVVFFFVIDIYRRRSARRLAKVNAAKERMESELSIARNIQMSMVPSTFPDVDGVDMYASMTPAKEVGGDLYGYHLEGENLYFAVGDVSGKGVPASLFMAQATRLFLTMANQGMMPAEICSSMNAALSGEDNESSMFVTMFLGLLDLKTGHLIFCNAGHNPPVIMDHEKGEMKNEECPADEDYYTPHFLEIQPNAPIGLWPGLEYEGEEIDSIKGRPLLIYTDGLNEAENQQQEQLGDDRLLELLRTTRFVNTHQIIDALAAAVEHHRDGAEPNDDLTMMCIKL